MGHNTAFIGKVGNDFFGDQLRAAIKEAGIDDIGLCTDEKIHTTLAMVHTYPDGDRDFSFYRNPGADMMLNKTEIDSRGYSQGNRNAKFCQCSSFYHYYKKRCAASNARTRRNPTVFKYYQKCK